MLTSRMCSLVVFVCLSFRKTRNTKHRSKSKQLNNGGVPAGSKLFMLKAEAASSVSPPRGSAAAAIARANDCAHVSLHSPQICTFDFFKTLGPSNASGANCSHLLASFCLELACVAVGATQHATLHAHCGLSRHDAERSSERNNMATSDRGEIS